MTMNRKKHIITIAGAGSARVPALVGNLIEMKERFPLTKVIFYDIDNERMGKMQALEIQSPCVSTGTFVLKFTDS